MDLLLNPNIAYILLVMATFLAMLALIAPGSLIAETGAFLCAILAGYAVYHLSCNWWALLLLFLSIIPFVMAARGPRREVWLVLSILGLIVGSVFFFPSSNGLPSVNPLLAILTSTLLALFAWISARKVLQISQTKPVQDLSTLIGQRGRAKTPVEMEGSVQVAGELWSARSKNLILRGSTVRVIGREGFVLIVENESS
jgi:membrane-bound ClpP family serine protease